MKQKMLEASLHDYICNQTLRQMSAVKDAFVDTTDSKIR